MSSFRPSSAFSSSSFDGAVLVVPSVSLANLPQLAVDILITSLGLQKVGYIGDGETVVPFFGPGEGGETVTGGLEVYGDTQKKVFVVQQRSPCLKDKKDEHVDLIQRFITEHDFEFTLFITSINSANQNDAQILTPHQQIIPSQSSRKSRYSSKLTTFSPLVDPSSDSPYPPFLPSGGLTRRYLSALQGTKSEHAALAAWCVEGDNRDDARSLAASLLHLLELDVELREPKAWEGLFGAREGWSGGVGSDAELYG